MTSLAQDIECPLPRRTRMRERELVRRSRLGFGRSDYSRWRGIAEAEVKAGTLTILRDPGRAELQRELDQAALDANGRARLRRVAPLKAGPVLHYPHGLMEDTGNPDAASGLYWPWTSFVGVAWVTTAGVKHVRVWGYRCHAHGGPEYRHLFLPDVSDREGRRCCWALIFPHRYSRLRELRVMRLRKTLERIGPPGEDDRTNLNLRTALLRAHVPGVGAILSDDFARTRLVQVVVRDPSTGLRHHMTVPPRFGDPRTRTFQRLGNARARIRAAVAWTFGMRPEEYDPALEA